MDVLDALLQGAERPTPVVTLRSPEKGTGGGETSHVRKKAGVESLPLHPSLRGLVEEEQCKIQKLLEHLGCNTELFDEPQNVRAECAVELGLSGSGECKDEAIKAILAEMKAWTKKKLKRALGLTVTE